MEAYILKPGADVLSRSIDDYPDGIIIPIDKPYRWTSADVIRKIKFAAIRHFGKKNLKVGHAGTLDPLATGVLLVCIGKATKMAEELQSHDKEYVAGITFGATTPSYDLEKEIDRFFPYEHLSREAVAEALPAFIGEQDQIAPLFSAKSVDGVRAYELARKLHKEGRTLDDAAEELIRVARINISDLELVSFESAGCGLSDVRCAHPTTALELVSFESAGCGLSDVRCAHPTTALRLWSPRFRAAGGTVLESRISADSEVNSSHSAEADASHSVEADASHSAEADASHSVEADASHFVEADASHSVEADASHFVEADASHSVEAGRSGGGLKNDPSHFCEAGPSPCGQGGSTVFHTTASSASAASAESVSKASSRINVTDNSELGLPRAVVRMACSKGTYVRAFARDLGEALGSGAHLDSLQRSRSGIFRVEDALTVEQATSLLWQTTP